MTKNVTFYGHEQASADILTNVLNSMDCYQPDIQKLIPVVRNHQTRFRENTKHNTYRAFIRKIGKDNIDTYFASCLTDRAGNDNNIGKPLETREFIYHKHIIKHLATTTIEVKDLALSTVEVMEIMQSSSMGFGKLAAMLNQLVAVVQLRPERNTKLYLSNFIRGNHVAR